MTGGQITLDRKDIRRISMEELREEIGFVPQKGVLFSGTIASNLRFGKADATDEDIKEAAEIAQATEFIETKKEKYDSPIAQGGSNVSGGQKQRAAVTRALMMDPELLLADEPTGALDSKATDELLQVFSELHTAGQTILMVTHSTKAASHASRVLFIKDGEVFHQLYRGSSTNEEMYQKIANTLTLLTTGGDENE